MNRTVLINGTEQGLRNRFKAQVIDCCGKIVFETDWAPNLILESGMTAIASNVITSLFTHACIGSGTTPTSTLSGAITATTSGTSCTASSAFFSSGMVGELIYFPSTGQSATITAYTNTTTVTLSATLGLSSGTLFTIYAINQTGLVAEVHRTSNYLIGAGNCGTAYAGGVYTHQRTFVFPVETSSQSYSEVGFSSTATVGANLNMRGIFPGAPISVGIGQQLRVSYFVQVTVTPITPRARTVPLNGWPGKNYPVTVNYPLGLFIFVGYPFPLNTVVYIGGSVNPGGTTYGDPYYLIPNDVNSFFISETPSGSPVTLTSNGTSVVMFANTDGNEQLAGDQFSAIDVDGNTISGAAFPAIGEPSVAKSMGMSQDNLPLSPYNTAQPAPVIPAGGTASMSAASYTPGSYTLQWSGTFPAVSVDNEAIYKLFTWDGNAVGNMGLIYFFKWPQNQPLGSITITVVWQYTWARIFV